MQTAESASVRPASVPSDPIAARAFLQSRVRLYIGVALAIWSLALCIDRLIAAVTLGSPLAGPGGVYLPAHYVALGMLGALYLVTRRRQRSELLLRSMEVCATLVQAVLGSILLGHLPMETRPDILSVFSTTLFLVLRAGLIPGRALGALVVGVLAMTPPIVLTIWLHTTRPLQTGGQSNLAVPLLYVLEWACMSLAATTVVHSVIYGLQERVQELGQYTLLHKIGEGGMGVVYRARHALLRRPTAVKVLPIERTTAQGLTRFEREVQLTAELAHPSIVSVYDFGRTPDGSFYYAMELLEGVDLQRLVEEYGPLPPERAVHLLAQAADALAEAHDVGLIHRDIKPANLLVGNRARRHDHLTVLDFGLAKDLSQRDAALSVDEVITGTPLYMAPEAIVEPSNVDGRSDIYGLGAVAYWLLSGSPPFSGRSLMDVCAAHVYKQPEPPSQRLGRSLPSELEALVLACLAKDRVDRPSSASTLLDRLRALPLERWSVEDARDWWQSHAQRPPIEPRESLEHARTLAIARRVDPGV